MQDVLYEGSEKAEGIKKTKEGVKRFDEIFKNRENKELRRLLNN